MNVPATRYPVHRSTRRRRRESIRDSCAYCMLRAHGPSRRSDAWSDTGVCAVGSRVQLILQERHSHYGSVYSSDALANPMPRPSAIAPSLALTSIHAVRDRADTTQAHRPMCDRCMHTAMMARGPRIAVHGMTPCDTADALRLGSIGTRVRAHAR